MLSHRRGNHPKLWTSRSVSRSDSEAAAATAIANNDCKQLAMLGCVTMLHDAPPFGNWISQSGSVALVLNAPDGGNCVVQAFCVALLSVAGGHLRLEAGRVFIVFAACVSQILTLACPNASHSTDSSDWFDSFH